MSIEQCRRRFAWACQHLELLNSSLAPLREAYAYPPLRVEHKDGGCRRQWALDPDADLPPVDPALGLIFGDCLHNFRATLDNLIYSLSELHCRRLLTPDEANRPFFPIAGYKTDFRKARRRGAIAYLPARVQARVQRLQPYKTEEEPEWHPLSILRELSDRDKHRFALIGIGTPSHHSYVYEPGVQGRYIANILEPGTPFFELVVPPHLAKVDMQVNLSFAISLKEPARLRGRDAYYWLNDIRACISDAVFPELEVDPILTDSSVNPSFAKVY
ncbi:MAG TPA: hypothetical protein VGB14_13785 [Acidimicrobiales bacterium]|jgi:hypothetical protein